MGQRTFAVEFSVLAEGRHGYIFVDISIHCLVGGAGRRCRQSLTPCGLQWQYLPSQHPTDWSRDGRFVLYYEVAPDTQRDLWILPVTREGKPDGAPRIYLRTPFNELLGCFSPEVS